MHIILHMEWMFSGKWYDILQFVNMVGVVSNSFLIAFTSSWGQKYDTAEKLWIAIGFEVSKIADRPLVSFFLFCDVLPCLFSPIKSTCYIMYVIKRKRRRSDSVLWQKPLYQQNFKNQWTIQKCHRKLRLHNDCGPKHHTVPFYSVQNINTRKII